MIKDFGYGAVFVKVFNSEDQEITPPKITHFRYVHSEKADDASTIVIESLDPNLPDTPGLQEHRKIKLLWGYMGGAISGKRSVYIFDINTNYDEQGVRMELKCYDRLAYLKLTSNTVMHEGTPDEIANKIAEDNGLDIIQQTDDGLVIDEPLNRTPAILQADGFISAPIDNTARDLGPLIIPQANKSEFKALQEVVDRKAGGPWVLEGRDDSMIIRKRNFNQTPLKSYRYKDEPGYLLKFSPETKNKSHRAGATNVNVSGWNPEMKSYIQGDLGQVHDQDVVLGEFIEDSERTRFDDPSTNDPNSVESGVISREDIDPDEEGSATQSVDLAMTELEGRIQSGEVPEIEDEREDAITPGDEELETTVLPDGTIWKHFEINSESRAIQFGEGKFKQAVDNTAVIVKGGSFLKPDLNERIHTAETTPEGIVAEGLNKRKNEELEKNPANATILGDPILESGKIITILNVSKKHSGNYYITQAEHVVDFGSGYVVNLQLVRNGDNLGGLGKISSKKFSKKKINTSTGKTEDFITKEVTIQEVTITPGTGMPETDVPPGLFVD